MLTSLRINNFALIDHLDLKLGSGLNVFTGETGAGKSIILDALNATLGAKIDRRIIRTGTKRAILEATFDLNSDLAEWLSNQEIEPLDGKLVVCSREIVVAENSLRTRSRVNGILVNRKIMDQIRDRLVEITAQGQTVQLGNPDMQREWLDLYGGHPLLKCREAVNIAYQKAQKAKAALENRRQSEKGRLQRIDLLQYQLQELDKANLTEAQELEQLIQESQRLSHAVELQHQSYQIYQALYQSEGDNSAAADLLGEVETILNDMVNYDSTLQPISEMISEALAQVVEASRQISSYNEQLEADPQRLEDVEERIKELKQICRKYGPTLEEAINYYYKIQVELKELLEGGESLEAQEKTYQEAKKELQNKCNELSLQRQNAATKLETHLVEELKPMAMEKVKFQVQITSTTPTSTGADHLIFCFSSNPGEPLQPLNLTASGGEMSRFLLALKACFSQTEVSGTLVFDEIDVGVSGRVAGAISEKLHQLSRQNQVLCVTHQPIVAAMADHHFNVSKQVIKEMTNIEAKNQKCEERTIVRVKTLDNYQRREELAQLASGRSAQEAIAFAESLLTQAATKREKSLTSSSGGE
ncbi:DNA repair protein RecN [Okeania sp.]|uniref:DNA repair protein RecN n=1 Tax=Okeania sp. TaxID=3100323 RepID=UPI002B4B6FFC|nr:DNA repair protein RecN [Okeania sp.]MEB3342514.1 DNA repair protein RecN [Okeania sp.]